MSYEGTVQNGVIVLSGGEKLPEGMLVRVESLVPREAAELPATSFADRVREIAQSMDDMPTDFAEQHDHYLYGHPKR